jgi:hypothetical protein
LRFYGDAGLAADGTVRLLSTTADRSGAAWTYVQGGAFRTDFDVTWTNGLPEGIALVLAPSPGRGSAGAGLGYAGVPGIAIELDLHQNVEVGDQVMVDSVSGLRTEDVISIHTAGWSVPNSALESYSIGAGGASWLSPSAPSPKHVTVEIEPAGDNLGWIRVYLDSDPTHYYGIPMTVIPTVQAQIQLPDAAYLGLTASNSSNNNGAYSGSATISNWTVQASAPLQQP